LLAQAPTGIGKTLGSLFPLLKAWPAAQLDKIFFLTAKSSGRQLALDALTTLGRDTPLRVLELTARDKACEHPDKACHGESCPLARGFYDRLPAARQTALKVARLDRHALREVALEHDVCPYYLSQNWRVGATSLSATTTTISTRTPCCSRSPSRRNGASAYW
jgi:DNA excision repair protein ERCC-2